MTRLKKALWLSRRLGSGLVTLWAVSVLVFLAMRAVPGSYLEVALGQSSTPGRRKAIIEEYDLDAPLVVQYWDWLSSMLTGDFGHTLGTNASIGGLLSSWVPVTAELTGLALVITIVVGVPCAFVAGLGRRRARGAGRFGGALAMSVPDFVIGSALVYLLSRYETFFTVGGYVPVSDGLVANLKVMMPPALTLSLFGIALVVRTGSDAVATVMSSPHVTAAISRGESRAHIVRHHVLRNASIPMLTVLAVYSGYLLGGAVIVEQLFSLPGVGQAVLAAIQGRDYPVVQVVVFLAAAAFIAINVMADWLYGVLDPRVVMTGQ